MLLRGQSIPKRHGADRTVSESTVATVATIGLSRVVPVMNDLSCRLFVTADDRTGALEIGGVMANSTFPVPVGPLASDELCAVVDIGSRHLSPTAAADALTRAHRQAADLRCHKMDSGLRGNWPYEVQALNQLGHRVAVVPSFPDAGRRCRDGVVYIQGVPVLESPFASDPLTAPVSSRPMDILEATSCHRGDVVVWDADNNDELRAAISRCRTENRVLVGPTGAIGAYGATVFPGLRPARFKIVPPVLIICGSLNPVSRGQLDQLHCPRFGVADDFDDMIDELDLAIVQTPLPDGPISGAAAVATAKQVAERARQWLLKAGTLLVIGGDTAAAIVGDETLEVLGTVATGIPIARFGERLLVTKGGGIGTTMTLAELLAAGEENPVRGAS
jgi:uncharacterized protein YgbK (DUF1537 family)